MFAAGHRVSHPGQPQVDIPEAPSPFPLKIQLAQKLLKYVSNGLTKTLGWIGGEI